MHKVQVWVEIPDDKFDAYVDESHRRGVTVESLVERMVRSMLRDVEQDEHDGTDHPIFPG
jgi:hypothetical protein